MHSDKPCNGSALGAKGVQDGLHERAWEPICRCDARAGATVFSAGPTKYSPSVHGNGDEVSETSIFSVLK